MPMWKLMGILAIATLTTACAPLLIGGGAAVVADKAVEGEKGGDGLF